MSQYPDFLQLPSVCWISWISISWISWVNGFTKSWENRLTGNQPDFPMKYHEDHGIFRFNFSRENQAIDKSSKQPFYSISSQGKIETQRPSLRVDMSRAGLSASPCASIYSPAELEGARQNQVRWAEPPHGLSFRAG